MSWFAGGLIALGVGFAIAILGGEVAAMMNLFQSHHYTVGGVVAAIGGLIALDGFLVMWIAAILD